MTHTPSSNPRTEALRMAADILDVEAATAPAETDLDLIESAATEARRLIAHLEQSRDTQPERLAAMRARVNTERDHARLTEPWRDTVGVLPGYDGDGNVSGLLGLPSLDAKAVWATRFAFDLASRDLDIKEQLSELFSDLGGDIDHILLVLAEACEVFAENIVAPMLEVIERSASNYDMRVNLADAARNAWSVRAADLAGTMPADDEEAEASPTPGDEP